MPSRITQRARNLRSNPTDVEKKVWQRLRQDQLGVRFRRQYVIGSYITDFACPSLRIVIELDGGQHNEASAYEDRRTAFIEAQGYKILRFWNSELVENLDGVIEAIFAKLQGLSPDPSPEERGNLGL